MVRVKAFLCVISVGVILMSTQAEGKAGATKGELAASHKVMRLKKPKISGSGKSGGEGALFDINPKNRWSTNEFMKPGMWLKVEFAKGISLYDMTIDAGTSRGDYPRRYEIYVSEDGKNWGTPVASGKGKVRTEISGLNTQGKFVKIVQTGSHGGAYWSVHDLIINGLSFSEIDKINSLVFPKRPGVLDSVETRRDWVDLMVKASAMGEQSGSLFAGRMWKSFPLMCDWLMQDNKMHSNWGVSVGYDPRGDFAEYLKEGRGLKFEQELVKTVAAELKQQVSLPATGRELLTLYIELCMKRRGQRLASFKKKTDTLIYSKHQNMGGIYLATGTEGCPNGSDLRSVSLKGEQVKDELVFDSKNGIVRDPEISFDGRKMLFAWRKTNKGFYTSGKLAEETGNYKIYEMDLASREMRALTDDSTYGVDIEPCYLPNGDIMFSSTRCVQEVTCGWADCTNMFIMNKDGKYARRVGYDQTQTAFPHLLDDGRVVYTRRDYNDRGQSFAHALFTMNADGTTQTEYYGNNSMAPTSIQHTRQIPGTSKTMGVAGGYHTSQGGKLVVVDPSKGRQNYEGVSFINWTPTPLDEIKGENYSRVGEQYSYPYPLDENSLLVSFSPLGGYLMDKKGVLNNKEKSLMRYKVYYMTLDGKREMLAADPRLSCMQPVPVMARKRPAARASVVDYTKETARMYVQDIYYGPGLKGIKRGTVKKIRVNEILYKPTIVGAALMRPPRSQVGPGKKYSGYGWHTILPVGVGSASFDAKKILGEVDVHKDGSAMFEIPARTPIYLQMIDANGDVVQTMRSWATLMPNETFSCVGCHEDKNSTPLQQGKRTVAMTRAPQKLKPLHNISGKPFSYAKMVQPILNKHCASCHSPGNKAEKFDLSDSLVLDNNNGKAGNHGNTVTQRKFYKSYLTLLDVKWSDWKKGKEIIKKLGEGRPNKWVNYYTRLLTTELIPPYYAGSAKSGLLKKLREGHAKVKLSEAEMNTISAWIDLNVPFVGDYDEMNTWVDASKKRYAEKVSMRHKQEEIERKNIQQFIRDGQQ